MKLITISAGCVLMLMIRSIHSIKLARLETNESRDLRKDYLPEQGFFTSQSPSVKIMQHRSKNDQATLRRVIDLSTTTVAISYTDTTLYVNEGDGL
jgi:hypothetical protein